MRPAHALNRFLKHPLDSNPNVQIVHELLDKGC